VTCRFDARFRWDLDLTPGGVVGAAGFLIVKDPRDPELAGTHQPRIPDRRETLVATWHAQRARSTSLSHRNSGRQHTALFDTATQARYNHPDPDAYGVVSHCRVFDAKVLYKLSPQWSGSVDVDHIGNFRYCVNPNLHTYPQRTLFASVKYDY
jgi:hypothetical protein